MARLVGLLLLAASLAWGAECTSVSVTNVNLVKRRTRTVIVASVQFVGDTVNGTRDYEISGANANDQLRRIVFDECATAAGFASIAVGPITPQGPPSGVIAAITDMQEAARRKTALLDYQALMGLTGADTIGVSSITVNQAIAVLDTAINENANNAANINRMLDNWPR